MTLPTDRPIVPYYRVSTRKQEVSGLGLDAQRADVQEYATRHGRAILAEYTETETGKRCDRPALANAMAHARRAGATVVVAKLDRLARNARFLLGIVESGADVVFLDLPEIPPGPAGKFVLTAMAGAAELESGMASVRTKAALAAYRARGGKLGTLSHRNPTMPTEIQKLGSKAAALAKQDRAREAYADLLPRIRNLRESGLSLQAIADDLNASGYRTRTGKPFDRLTVFRILGRTQ